VTFYPQPNTSEVQRSTFYPQPNTSEVQPSTFYPQRNTSEVQRNTFYPQRNTSEVQRNTFYPQRNTSEVQRSTFYINGIPFTSNGIPPRCNGVPLTLNGISPSIIHDKSRPHTTKNTEKAGIYKYLVVVLVKLDSLIYRAMEHVTTSEIRHKSALRTILLTGLLAGTLDGTTAVLVYGHPEGIFRSIASGAFGREMAFSGGPIMVVMGVLFHYFIAMTWTTIYFFLYPRLRNLPGNKYVFGIYYGTIVWMAMNLIVIPLSRIKARELQLDQSVIGITILIFMIGLPISILVHRHYNSR
jgi:hypothetical protein